MERAITERFVNSIHSSGFFLREGKFSQQHKLHKVVIYTNSHY
ncbi:hypothetical protein [Wolbachia endosymbiont (group A) of Brachyopa scutellaris]